MEATSYSSRFCIRFVGCALIALLVAATASVAQVAMGPALGQPDKAAPPAPPKPKEEPIPPPTKSDQSPIVKALPAPDLEPGDEGFPISLPAALRLANAQAWDIIIAQQQLRVATAQLQGANVLWLPTLQTGVDFQYHSGPIQASDGSVSSTNHSNMYVGEAPLAFFAITDAIFAPLAARQVVRAQDANIQTARNDTLTSMAEVYFDLIEAEADLAAILDVNQRATEMVKKGEALGTQGVIPGVEVARVKAAKANFEQVVETARQRWRDASAEVARVTRLRPTVVLQPLEPPQLQVTLIPMTMTPDELIPMAVAARPELTFEQALAEAARQRLRQERWRPFLPTILARGGGTTPPDAMAFGAYAGGPGSDLGSFAQRSDWDVGAYWELRNLGFGNRALIRQRRAEYDIAISQQYRFRDLVAKEVTQAWADVRSAQQRMEAVLRELREADRSARLNVESMAEIKRVGGGINILVIRPLEVVASLQALSTAYVDYFGVMADYNRAQFRLYRAVGSPAQAIAGRNGLNGPLLPDPELPPCWPLSPAAQTKAPQKADATVKAPGQ